MKINLLINSMDVRSGYTNIDPFATQDPGEQRVRAQLGEIHLFADSGEVTEFLAVDVVDYVPANEKSSFLDYVLGFLAIDGEIVIGGTNIDLVTKSYANAEIDLDTVNQLLFGTDAQKFGMVNQNQMAHLLRTRGMEVIEKKNTNFHYTVRAVRNG